ncbi:MAG: response regulator [Burkholderiales bacterium]|nr:response regulator [Burkholderiales bacterium]
MPLVQGRGISLLFDWHGAHEWVLGDERCIRQIVTNLVGNAVKFTEQGHVSLVGRSQPRPDGQLAIEIRIEDSGPGIPAAQRDHIFAAFSQGDESLSRQHGGTGLGLAIARELALAMGGELSLLRGEADTGAAFTLALVLPAASPGVADAPAVPAGRRVWLVYPMQEGSAWMQRRFEQLGCHTDRWPDLATAIARAAAGEPAPDLVLISQPALTDSDELRRLRAALPRAALHLAIRPDWFDPRFEAEARALGIGSSVTPYTPRTLRELLNGQPRADLPPRSAGPDLRVGAEVLLVEDNPVNQLIGQEFLRALGLQVRLAANGLEALEACRARAPELVLMDLQMPEMDGLEATRRLCAMQADGHWSGAPIVALTAHASEADAQACRAAGMVAILTKPMALETLRAELARWLPA